VTTARTFSCVSCGGPLTAPWDQIVIVCPACGAHNLPAGPAGYVPPSVPVDGRPRVNLGGRTYVIEGRLADGDSSSVYRARWVSRLGEAVVIKVLAVPGDADLLAREWDVLRGLQASQIQGSAHFVTRLPVPVARGLVETDEARIATVYGWKSGFVHTLEQVGEQWPDGVKGEVQVWLLKRLLELLGFVHRAGVVHGAVTPAHVLVHPRDHGAMLVGWTAAQTASRPVPLGPRPRRWEALYEGATLASPTLDIQMACRCAAAMGPTSPGPVADVIAAGARGQEADAWALAEQLTAASRRQHGPAGYHPLAMPGWV